MINQKTTYMNYDENLSQALSYAKEVIKVEIQELISLEERLNDDFIQSIELILECKGKCVLIGMGKSGIIARKIAATLSSTGTPSFFVHPSEAFHGDLGMIEKGDIVILISNSGFTSEVLQVIPYLRYVGIKIISITGNINSTLAKNSDVSLNISVTKEACPLNMAPTSSTTLTLVLGDAIAVALMKIKKFNKEDFTRFHPGGNLGRRLLTKLIDVTSNNFPVVSLTTDIIDVIHNISIGKRGMVLVKGSDFEGIITDGDIRRAMERKPDGFFELLAKDIMSINPVSIDIYSNIEEAKRLMLEKNISCLIVTKDNVFNGVLFKNDLEKF